MRTKAFLIGLLSSCAIILAAIWQAQNISDWLALRSYDPPSRVSKIASDTTMNDKTRRLFYINHPELNDKPSFRTNCVQNGEQTIVLGCFVEGGGIFLLDVEDPRLNGVIEVTAAHEVLHAAYERLSAEERLRVDKMTAEAFKNVKSQRVKDTVEQYRKNDASVVPNELHSILGTEVEDLPKDLEQYYSQYFEDRSKIVGFLKQYENAFIEIRQQVKQYDKQLSILKKSIDINERDIESRGGAIDSKRAEMDRLLSSRQVEQYNAAVSGFNQQVETYNLLVQETKSLIDRYNEIVEKRNKAVTNEEELVDALDSSKLTTQ